MAELLKSVLENLDELDEQFHTLYTMNDGEGGDKKFHFTGVEGLVTKEKVNKFRQNNINLSKEINKMKEDLDDLKGLDPDKYQEMKDKLDAIEEGELIKKGDVDGLVAKRLEKLQEKSQKRNTELQTGITERDKKVLTLETALAGSLIKTEIMDSIEKAQVGKLRAGALKDVIARAEEVFRPVETDGKYDLKSEGRNGEPVYSSEDPTKELTQVEWVKTLFEEAPFFFEGSKGSGAGGGDQIPPSGGPIVSHDQVMTDTSGDLVAKIATGKIRYK